jgi:integrase
MVQRLSDKAVKELEAPDTGNRITYDTEVKGFGCRTTAAGTKSFVLNYRTRSGHERRFTIGKFPEWTTAAARDEAKRLKGQISVNGLDPVGGLKAERSAPTMADLAERYLDEHASRKRTKGDDERIFRSFILKTGLAHKKVAEVSFADMDGLHRRITKNGTPYRANRVIATLSKAFNLSIRWGWRANNPCKGIERNQEQKRTRYLSSDELGRLSKALAEHRDRQAANIVRLLLLTGARRGEVRSATWDQFDLDQGVWTKPGATTKQKTEHRIPLSAPARQLLSELRAAADDDATYVFPGRSGGHRDNIKDAWASLCKAAGLKAARVHDLRHTYASMLASAGFSLPMIGALLGHTQPMTTARYAHLFDDPLREATERVGAVILPANAGADVVKLRGSRA